MSNYVTITRKLEEFGDRLLDLKIKKKFCDAEIIVGTERIPVHKHILASSSAFFDTEFSGNESKREIVMKDVDSEIVHSLIEYCYTGIIRVSEKYLNEIIMMADLLKMTPITEGCVKELKNRMDPSNCISTWILANNCKNCTSKAYENLKSIAFEYARQNYEMVSQLPEFLDLNDSEILELISSDIIVANETIVFNSVTKWIDHDSSLRKQHLDKLLEYVRFEYLPGNILSGSEIQSFCNDNSSTECLNKILNAQRWKNNKQLMPFDGNLRDSYNTLTVIGSHSQFIDIPKTMEIFDLRNEKWTKIEKFECDRVGYSAVLLEHKLILIGGFKSNADVNTVQSYDLKTGTIENLPPMKYARSRLSAVEFKGRLYAIGGRNKIPSAYVEMWDPELRKWVELTPMPMPRSECEASVIEEMIFVIGGYDGRRYLSDTESYNPVTDKWIKCASMNEERTAPGVIFTGGYLYAVGGWGKKTAERYDPKIDKWSMIHSLEINTGYMGVGRLFGNFVIVGGAIINDHVLSTMKMYDEKNDNWIPMPSLNGPRRFLKAIKIPWSLAKTMLSREVPK